MAGELTWSSKVHKHENVAENMFIAGFGFAEILSKAPHQRLLQSYVLFYSSCIASANLELHDALAPTGTFTPLTPAESSLNNHVIVSATLSGSSRMIPRLAISASASSSFLYQDKDIPVFVAPAMFR